MICTGCEKEYKTQRGLDKHICKRGTCDTCHHDFKSLTDHKCAVKQVFSFEYTPLSQENIGKICDGCTDWYPLTNSFRVWKNIDLCRDCYNIGNIQREVNTTRQKLSLLMVEDDQCQCQICHEPIICPITHVRLRAGELDHVRPWEKIESVGTMILQGYQFEDIVTEYYKCRLLCIRCHACVTYSQKLTGSIRLKNLELSPKSRDRVQTIVKAITRKVLSV
jgi:hypothetical protein